MIYIYTNFECLFIRKCEKYIKSTTRNLEFSDISIIYMYTP